MSIDAFLDRQHRPDYNCADFAREVWMHLGGIDIGDALRGLLALESGRRVTRHHVRSFEALHGPISPCLVLMQNPRLSPHIGVHLRGRILHLAEQGVEYQPVKAVVQYYKSFRFIKCRSN